MMHVCADCEEPGKCRIMGCIAEHLLRAVAKRAPPIAGIDETTRTGQWIAWATNKLVQLDSRTRTLEKQLKELRLP